MIQTAIKSCWKQQVKPKTTVTLDVNWKRLCHILAALVCLSLCCGYNAPWKHFRGRASKEACPTVTSFATVFFADIFCVCMLILFLQITSSLRCGNRCFTVGCALLCLITVLTPLHFVLVFTKKLYIRSRKNICLLNVLFFPYLSHATYLKTRHNDFVLLC